MNKKLFIKIISLLIFFWILPMDTLNALDIINIESAGTHSALKHQTQTVTFPLSTENKSLINEMKKKLYDLDGVGLAATQVNSSQRIAVIYIPENASLLRDNATPYPMHVLINAQYEGIEKDGKSEDFESCYSVHSKAGKVPRYNTIKLRYQDENGTLHTLIEKGFYARVLQHEIDHLNGLLLTDRLTPNNVQGTPQEMMALRRKELSSEKLEVYDALVKKKLHPNDHSG